MVKNSFLFGLLTLAVFLLAPTVMSAADAPAEVRAAAEKGFPYVKASIGKNPGQYGYEDASQAEQVTLGRAVRLRELDWDKVKTNNAKSLMALTKPTDSWRFFAEVAGKPTSIIDVEWLDGRYQVVRFGGDPTYLVDALREMGRHASANEEILMVDMIADTLLVSKANGKEVVMSVVEHRKAGGGNQAANGLVHAAADVTKALKAQANKPLPARPEEMPLGGYQGLEIPAARQPILPWAIALGALLVGGTWVVWRRKASGRG
ncbi:MAG TPA: hypothetical protein VD973_11710 [Symbiobacteriaceae bacterium]|nr:hypothetical protein [Symbiobacteriaceae bacterium]